MHDVSICVLYLCTFAAFDKLTIKIYTNLKEETTNACFNNLIYLQIMQY